jgi:hypothetical protein
LTPQTIATIGLVGPEWLVMTGGQLWTTKNFQDDQSDSIVSVDPSTGAITSTLSGSFYEPDLAVSPGDPSTLFVVEDGLSPGAGYRFDVSTTPATQFAHNGSMDQENVEGLVISPNGTRVIPASGWPYHFEELDATTLNADGIDYPVSPYPSAAAVSASGMLATGVNNGYSSPDISVFALGAPAATFTASTDNSNGTANVLPHGLALSADGSTLFAALKDSCNDTVLDTMSTVASSSVTLPTTCGSTGTPPAPPAPNPTPTPSPTPGTTPPPASPAPTTPPQPPFVFIHPTKPRRGKPDLSVEVGAFRITLISRATHQVVGYRYFFSAEHMHCINGATNVAFTIDSSRHVAPCTSHLILIGKQVSPHKTYTLHIQAVRMRKHRIVKRGPSHPWKAYMPGNEITWVPTGTVPPTY